MSPNNGSIPITYYAILIDVRTNGPIDPDLSAVIITMFSASPLLPAA